MIRGKTILITGASSGLGRAMALSLARGDNNLVVTARRAALLEALAEEVRARGSRCTVAPADALDRAACEGVIAAAIGAYGRIDVAILNAGGGRPLSLLEASSEEVLAVIRLNLDTLVHFLCPLVASMKGVGGTIAWTGSPAGFFGLPRSGPYSAAKAAGRVLLDSARIDLAGSGIDLVALYPGFTRTPGLDPEDVPFQALIIEPERAAREMLGAIERRRSHRMFPRRIRWLITLGRLLPEWARRRLLVAVGR